jgi:hypothetical protein
VDGLLVGIQLARHGADVRARLKEMDKRLVPKCKVRAESFAGRLLSTQHSIRPRRQDGRSAVTGAHLLK